MKELLLVAIVLACPLAMILMMRAHRHGGAQTGEVSERDPDVAHRSDQIP